MCLGHHIPYRGWLWCFGETEVTTSFAMPHMESGGGDQGLSCPLPLLLARVVMDQVEIGVAMAHGKSNAGLKLRTGATTPLVTLYGRGNSGPKLLGSLGKVKCLVYFKW